MLLIRKVDGKVALIHPEIKQQKSDAPKTSGAGIPFSQLPSAKGEQLRASLLNQKVSFE